ncbi:MAG: cohesin domain-containing protein [Euryarchaeota archaeon]|nr:cohesin domain-containing protein [Euryarchaeota archaeon]
MKMDGKALQVAVVIVVMVFSVYVTTTFPSSAIATADSFGIENANGSKNTMVLVPVTITTVQDGPIISIRFDIHYNNSVINVTGAKKGTLTSLWDSPTTNNFAWGTRVSLVYDGQTAHALQNESTGSVALLNFSVIGEPGETSMMNLTNIQLAGPDYLPGTAPAKNGTFSILSATSVFDTGSGTYPSISGIFNGTLKLNQTITVYNLYTYPCPGTGGHSEYVKIWNSTGWNVTTTWTGYKGDWHNISFNKSFSLKENEEYNYTIHTGSYPLIHHTPALPTANGWINCTSFVDANGKRYNNWIPAIRLSL